MKKLMTGLMASALAASMAFTGILPASAAPMINPAAPTAKQDVEKVQYEWRMRRGERRWRGGEFRGRHWRGERWRAGRDFADRGWRGRGDARYWNGHRGYRHWRRGYREYNGWWFPLAAFTAGAVITGALNDSRPVYRSGNRHVRWCYDHYRSYRAYDNTYQPYSGPRRQCYSPYS